MHTVIPPSCVCSFLNVTRRKQQRPGIASNDNTSHVPTARSSADPTKPNHPPTRYILPECHREEPTEARRCKGMPPARDPAWYLESHLRCVTCSITGRPQSLPTPAPQSASGRPHGHSFHATHGHWCVTVVFHSRTASAVLAVPANSWCSWM